MIKHVVEYMTKVGCNDDDEEEDELKQVLAILTLSQGPNKRFSRKLYFYKFSLS